MNQIITPERLLRHPLGLPGIYRSAKHSLFANNIGSMLTFQALSNPYVRSDSPRPNASNNILPQPGNRSKRTCRSYTFVTCHASPWGLSRSQERFQPVSAIGVTNGGKLAYSSEVFRRNRLLRIRHPNEVPRWCMAGGSSLEKGPRWQKSD